MIPIYYNRYRRYRLGYNIVVSHNRGRRSRLYYRDLRSQLFESLETLYFLQEQSFFSCWHLSHFFGAGSARYGSHFPSNFS